MQNDPNRAAAEGVSKDMAQRNLETTLWSVTCVVGLAADMLLDHYKRVGEHCELPHEIADQVTSILVMTREACEAKIAELSR